MVWRELLRNNGQIMEGTQTVFPLCILEEVINAVGYNCTINKHAHNYKKTQVRGDTGYLHLKKPSMLEENSVILLLQWSDQCKKKDHNKRDQ